MATANTGLQITNLDFPSIKNSLKNFLKSQDTLKDYNFDASGLSILLDLLAYNTQYNAFYLNMVANEMFLDSSVQRNSVVSHAKLLNYMPRSASAPKAIVTLTVNGVTDASLTLPKFSRFISEAIDGVNYPFLTTETYTAITSNTTATFSGIELAQGEAAAYAYTVDSIANPFAKFELPDINIDTSTLIVTVRESVGNSTFASYTLSDDYLNLDGESLVYFLQEGMNGKYEIYFGDGFIGKKLNNGNVVEVTYIVTGGSSAYGANSFTITQAVGGFTDTQTIPISSASGGADKETIDSVKFSAPKAYAAQGRAVTKEDYEYLIQKNSTNLPIDSVTVWGGEENDPPVYGQIYCAVKPSGGYTLTPTQKQRLVSEVIKPVNVMTVTPIIVDPDYTYLKLTINVLYNPKKTTYTASQLKNLVYAAVQNFSDATLNKFNATFRLPELITTIQLVDTSIITNECIVSVQKKFYPILDSIKNYTLSFGFPLKRNYYNAGVTSNPAMEMLDITTSGATMRSGVFIEEVPTTFAGVAEINVTNQGFGYSEVPTVTITGDGIGAEAYAVLVNGRVNSIIVTNPGSQYTHAFATITPAATDSTGGFATALVVLEGTEGTLQAYYYEDNIKTIMKNIGRVDYTKGNIYLDNFNPHTIENELGQLILTATPDSSIITSTYNKIVVIDSLDGSAVTINIIASQ